MQFEPIIFYFEVIKRNLPGQKAILYMNKTLMNDMHESLPQSPPAPKEDTLNQS